METTALLSLIVIGAMKAGTSALPRTALGGPARRSAPPPTVSPALGRRFHDAVADDVRRLRDLLHDPLDDWFAG